MKTTSGWRIVVIGGAMAAMVGFGGCRKPVPTSTQPTGLGYDPQNDPLVNPPTMLEPPPKDQSKIDMDQMLTYQLEGSPNTANPLFVSSWYDFALVDKLFKSPFTFDEEFHWHPDEDLVESFEESADHTEFILRLKPGLTWHDGHPLTAQDIVYSWKTILDPRVPCQTQKPTVEPITECVALDDRTVKYVQSEPLATRLWNLIFPIIPEHIFAKHQSEHPDLRMGAYYAGLERNPIGNGPYRLVEWKENDHIILERWDGYIGKKPPFKEIVFKIIPDSNVALLTFEKGDLDFLERLSPQQFAFETDDEAFAKVGYKAWGAEWTYGYIGWNMNGSNPFFTDRRVRYAMTHALNVPLINEKVYYNIATPCRGMYHPDAPFYNPEIKPLKYDPAKAAALLDEAGWKVDPNDGWRYKDIDGQRTLFRFELTYPQASPVAPQICAIFQQDLQRIGVQMTTRSIEWATFLVRTRDHDFQAETAAWGTGTDPDDDWNLWRTDQYKTGRNYGGYSNPRVDKLFEQGRREFDQAKRWKIYAEIDKLIYEDQPYSWLMFRPTTAAIQKRIRGIVFCPRGLDGFTPGALGWWVPRSTTAAAAMP